MNPLTLCACASALTVTGAPPEAGKPAPKLHIERLLQAPEDSRATWDDLKGRVVVLEFWATWCGPCVAGIPHLNRLAEKFEGEPICFIAITSEKAGVVEKFLKKKRMKAWIGIDPDGATFAAYGVKGIPRTIIVSRKGIVLAVTYPTSVTEQVLKKALAGERLQLDEALTEGMEESNRTEADRTEPPLFEVSIRRAPLQDSSGVTTGTGMLQLTYANARMIFSEAYDTRGVRLMETSLLPKGEYDVLVRAGKLDSKRIRGLLRTALEATFALSVIPEKREMECYVVRIPAGRKPTLEPSATPGKSTSFSRGRFNGTSLRMVDFASELEAMMQKPVLDETGLTDRYDIELTWDEGGAEAMIRAIREQLGLNVRLARRKIEVGVVRAIKPAE